MTSVQQIKVAIVDYQLGNLFSVQHACEKMGCSPIITSNPEEIMKVDGIILPGVGAFKAAMDNLKNTGLEQALIEFVKTGKPLMGVCLGMQLLFESSEEFEHCSGLALVPGVVKKFSSDLASNVKVPQIAWNTIQSPDNSTGWNSSPLKGTKQNEFMYFVHSYYAIPTQEDYVLTQTTYHHHLNYCSAVMKENIFATQFHPEKSGDNGLLIYKNWFDLILN